MIKKENNLYKLILESGKKIEVYSTEKEARKRLERIDSLSSRKLINSVKSIFLSYKFRSLIMKQNNIKKAQEKWLSMSQRQRTIAQPQGRNRAKPGTKGQGNYYRIIVRPKDEFTTFRFQDIGREGHALRLAGKRQSGSWATQAWLISKEDAHKERDFLIPDTVEAREILGTLGSVPKYIKGDVFEAKDRPNIPEKDKPTSAQKKARNENIEKAQATRWH